jgi:hypothetical protein
VQTLPGHAKPETTSHYTELPIGALRAGVAGVDSQLIGYQTDHAQPGRPRPMLQHRTRPRTPPQPGGHAMTGIIHPHPTRRLLCTTLAALTMLAGFLLTAGTAQARPIPPTGCVQHYPRHLCQALIYYQEHHAAPRWVRHQFRIHPRVGRHIAPYLNNQTAQSFTGAGMTGQQIAGRSPLTPSPHPHASAPFRPTTDPSRHDWADRQRVVPIRARQHHRARVLVPRADVALPPPDHRLLERPPSRLQPVPAHLVERVELL